MSIKDLIAAEQAATEANPDAPEQPGTVVTRGSARARTLQVRLTDDEFATIHAAADAAGLPVSTFARNLLLSTPTDVDRAAVIARIRSDLDKLAIA